MSIPLDRLRNLVGTVRRVLYLAIVLGLMAYLFSQGSDPWRHLLDHGHVFLLVVLINAVAIVVQAASYRDVQPSQSRSLSFVELVRIWSLSGLLSVVAPAFASLATRTGLLVRSGMELATTIISSVRQLWMGLEYAALFGGAAASFVDFPARKLVAATLVALGLVMVLLRIYAARYSGDEKRRRWYWLSSLQSPVAARAHVWFITQMVAMSAIYYVAFNGVGAPMEWQEAIFLAAITVVVSVVVVIPNGLGLLDALWVVIATRDGVAVEVAVVLPIILRLAFLVATTVVWLSMVVVGRATRPAA